LAEVLGILACLGLFEEEGKGGAVEVWGLFSGFCVCSGRGRVYLVARGGE